MWGDFINAQHTLLGAYIMTHAFIFFAVVLLFVEFNKELLTSKAVGFLLFLLITALCSIGTFLALQMHFAWQRTVALSKLIERHIRKLETSLGDDAILFFKNWHNVLKYPEVSIDMKDGLEEYTAPNALKQIDELWAGRAKTLPKIFGIFYIFVFIVSFLRFGWVVF